MKFISDEKIEIDLNAIADVFLMLQLAEPELRNYRLLNGIIKMPLVTDEAHGYLVVAAVENKTSRLQFFVLKEEENQIKLVPHLG